MEGWEGGAPGGTWGLGGPAAGLEALSPAPGGLTQWRLGSPSGPRIPGMLAPGTSSPTSVFLPFPGAPGTAFC